MPSPPSLSGPTPCLGPAQSHEPVSLLERFCDEQLFFHLMLGVGMRFNLRSSTSGTVVLLSTHCGCALGMSFDSGLVYRSLRFSKMIRKTERWERWCNKPCVAQSCSQGGHRWRTLQTEVLTSAPHTSCHTCTPDAPSPLLPANDRTKQTLSPITSGSIPITPGQY